MKIIFWITLALGLFLMGSESDDFFKQVLFQIVGAGFSGFSFVRLGLFR